MLCRLPSAFGSTCVMIKCNVLRLIGWWNVVWVLHVRSRAALSERNWRALGSNSSHSAWQSGINYCRPSVPSHLFHSALSHRLLISQGAFIRKRLGASKAFHEARLNPLLIDSPLKEPPQPCGVITAFDRGTKLSLQIWIKEELESIICQFLLFLFIPPSWCFHPIKAAEWWHYGGFLCQTSCQCWRIMRRKVQFYLQNIVDREDDQISNDGFQLAEPPPLWEAA